ncbi:MAG: dipeptidase [Bacteroidales bacterium]|nr:dipeptidase [Bacteroidales bacterium]
MKNYDYFINDLLEFLKIPSVSAKQDNSENMHKAAIFLKEILLKYGADYAEVIKTQGHPIVYGEKNVSKDTKTIIIYGHYDVMPAEPLEQWKTNPFEPVITDNKIFARGANDDKGQIFIQLAAFKYVVEHNFLKYNVKFIFEGEEEIGSTSLKQWLTLNKENINASLIVVSDTGMIDENKPSITIGLRGLVYLQIKVTGPLRDLHSGLYGGAVANPINILCRLIASVQDNNGKILIPGFYDDVIEFDNNQRALLNMVSIDEQKYKEEIGVKMLYGEQNYTLIERTSIRPTFDVCGIWGGYMGEGSKTIIPSVAFAKVSSRIVPAQTSKKIAELIKDYFIKVAPPYVSIEVDILHGGEPYLMPLNHKALITAKEALRSTYNIEPAFYISGGSIPIISEFEQILGVKSLLLGFGLDSDAIHAPNENFKLSQFEKGIKTLIEFYKNLEL